MSAQSAPPNAITSVKFESSYKSPPSSVSDFSQHEVESSRSRRQDRGRSLTAKADEDSCDEKDSGVDPSANGKARKRKRSRKGLDKNFPCLQHGCGKSYSRAEHLYRHQLNREFILPTAAFIRKDLTRCKDDPKQIFTCTFPGCGREFVRQDLCLRHRERHTGRGLHFQRKEPYDGRPSLPSPLVGFQEHPTTVYLSTPSPSHGTGARPPLSIPSNPIRSPVPTRMEEHEQSRTDGKVTLENPVNSPQLYPAGPTPDYSPIPLIYRSNSDERYYTEPTTATMYEGHKSDQPADIPNYNPNQGPRQPSFGAYVSGGTQKSSSSDTPQPRPSTHTFSSPKSYDPSSASSTSIISTQHQAPNTYTHNNQDSESYTPHQNFPPLPPLQAQGFPIISQAPNHVGQTGYTTPSTPLTPVETVSSLDMSGSGGMDPHLIDPTGATAPAFCAPHGVSPHTMADYFAAWLFNLQFSNNTPSEDFHHALSSSGVTNLMDDSGNMHVQYGLDDGFLNGNHQQQFSSHRTMAVESILEPTSPSIILSDEKRIQLLELIKKRFKETDEAPVQKQKEELLRGDLNLAGHVLSLQMMKTYIGSYWYHFHPQLPILHQPTFSADTTQNLLLIAVIAVGASCLDRRHGLTITKAGQDLSDFLAWHLRMEIFKDKDFTAPTKLWVFQALLLLEVYEKMYSTRILHERAHAHHGTTLTLMRRGSSLMGRSALDSPPTIRDGKPGVVSVSGQPALSTPDQWWNHWITNEATRRVCFAAFIIDSIHATMFGHAATLVAHEMKMQLPCDEAAWSAPNSAEVNRIESNLRMNGIKPISFFEGLKLTLNNKTVRTNAFGRTALMAGLLSVSWHMNQKDVQVRYLAALKSLGGKDVWRGILTKAFDSWRDDFDRCIGKDIGTPSSKIDEDIVFESRTVLHHLAHMAMHVDFVSCQIFAKAPKILGRKTLDVDYIIAQRRIREQWAPKPSARHATFHALKFLVEVLMPNSKNSKRSPADGGIIDILEYSAKDDFLLNRSWVLYFAALTVWSYGYALDGQVRSILELSTFEQQILDMRRFLERVGGINTPADLEHMRNRNDCMGLLLVLQDLFGKCRWELAHEAANLLSNCIGMLRGK